MNTSSAPSDSPTLVSHNTNAAPLELDLETVEQFIARVLNRAHQAALIAGAPDEARAILDLAQSFADEMATAIAGFDRLAFVAAVTVDVS